MKLKKEVKKQVRRVCKQTEKLFREFGEGESSAEYDTNEVLLRMDKIENELKALREAVNYEKKQQYLEKMGGPGRQSSISGTVSGGKYTLTKQSR